MRGRRQLERGLRRAIADRRRRRAGLRCRCAEVRALLADRLAGRPTRANFRTGTLTMCTMVPMRSVPHRVVCLLGLDDGVFPRMARPTATTSWRATRASASATSARRGPPTAPRRGPGGQRAPRRDLHRRGEHPGRTRGRPPCPVGELIDALDRDRRRTPERDRRCFVRHPLQPFDARNFTAGGLGPAALQLRPRPRCGALAGAASPRRAGRSRRCRSDAGRRRARRPRAVPRSPRPRPSSASGSTSSCSPTRTRWRRRSRWSLADCPAGRSVIGCSPRGCGGSRSRMPSVEWRRGSLPPGKLGTRVLDAVVPTVEATSPRRSPAASGSRTPATSARPRRRGGVRHRPRPVRRRRSLRVSFSRLGAKPLLPAWRDLLALSAAEPATPWQVVLGQGRDGASVTTLGPLTARGRAARLADLVLLRADGLARSAAAATARPTSTPSAGTAAARFPTPRPRPARSGSATTGCPGAHRRRGRAAVGRGLRLRAGHRQAAHAGEPFASEGSRFGQLARRVWEPILDVADASDARPAVRRLRPAADRDRRAGGERRHGQDVDARRARRPLRRRGCRRLGEILVVTFSRAARRNCASGCASGWPRPSARWPARRRRDAPDDPVLAGSLDVGDAELARRRDRLADALAAFDAATITTMHRFCGQVLTSLGIAGDSDADRLPRRGPRRPAVEVVEDLYLRKFATRQDAGASPAEALDVARRRSLDPQAVLLPAGGRRRGRPRRCGSRFARAVRAEIDVRKRRLGVLRYDDLLARSPTRWPAPARPPATGCARGGGSCSSTSSRTPTPSSGRSSTAPSPATRRMVLIGDPKQAIYAFRGGDVVTYLAPPQRAQQPRTLAQLAQRRRAARARWRRCSTAPHSATADRRAPGRRATT